MEASHPPTPPNPGGSGLCSHPEKGNYIQDLDGPVAPGLQQVVDTAVNGVYQSVILPGGEDTL